MIIKQKHHKFEITHPPKLRKLRKLRTLSDLLYRLISVGSGLRGATALLEGYLQMIYSYTEQYFIISICERPGVPDVT